MRSVFIACLGTETNTFSPLPTGLETFAETMLFRGDATSQRGFIFAAPLTTWRRMAEARGAEVVESIAAYAQPAGPTVRSVYESLRDELLADLRANPSLDMVLLSMHGAMVAHGYDDCEGDILERVRAIVGADCAIGVELDLHCSITPTMLDSADVIVTFKEYPHIDFNQRAEEVFNLVADCAAGKTRPVMATFDVRMISTWRTPVEPMASFVAHMQALEGRDGILSVSFAHGFPWGDVPHATARMLVVSDNDQPAAAALAEKLGMQIFALREQTHPRMLSVAAALDQAVAANHAPVVLADTADNAGGGAPSDSTFVLREILSRGLADVLSGLYWDPVAVRFCKEAGEGADIALRLGGKCGAMSGDPLDIEAKVMRIVDDATQSFGEASNRLGTAVWLQLDNGVDVVLNTVRTQVFNPDAFTQLGIDVARKKFIVVKSSQHFYAGFDPVAAEVLYVGADGTLNHDFASINYRKLTTPFWPRVADPHNSTN